MSVLSEWNLFLCRGCTLVCVCVCVCVGTWPKSSFIFFCKMLWKNTNDPFGQYHPHTCMHACMHTFVQLSFHPRNHCLWEQGRVISPFPLLQTLFMGSSDNCSFSCKKKLKKTIPKPSSTVTSSPFSCPSEDIIYCQTWSPPPCGGLHVWLSHLSLSCKPCICFCQLSLFVYLP